MQFATVPEARLNRFATPPETGWQRVPIRCIEDLGDAVFGAGLRAVQLSRQSVTGSLAFTAGDEIVLSSGYLCGKVSLEGPLSLNEVTFGVGLDLGAGTRHWLREVGTGKFGVFRPGGDHHAIYADRNLYLTLTLSEDRMMAEAAREGLTLDAAVMRRSGMYPGSFSPRALEQLRRGALTAHRGAMSDAAALARFRTLALAAFVEHLGRPPLIVPGLPAIRGYERIVARAREYIDTNLHEPISIDALAEAAGASRRSLQRAFFNVLEESPQDYVIRLRLHRIRSDLVANSVRIADAANRWGVSELGRMSGRYKAIFGELPSQTVRLKKTGAPHLGPTES